VANGHGGARPGSGPKPKNVEQYQANMRELTRKCVTEHDWNLVVSTAIARAQAGDASARAWLAAYITGAPETKVVHESDPDKPVRVVVEYKRKVEDSNPS
jgi:hypothetical protein